MHFSIKRDFILIFLFNALYVFVLFALALLALMPDAWFFWVIFAIVFGIMVIYDTSVIFASCDLDDDKITFKTGIFKYEIPFSQIARVEKSKNLYSSLAHSIDRLRILTYDENGKQKVYYIAVNDNDKLMDIINLKINSKNENEKAEVNKNNNSNEAENNEVSEVKAVEENTSEITTQEPKQEEVKEEKKTRTSNSKKASTTTKKTATTKKSSTTKKAKSTTSKKTTKTN